MTAARLRTAAAKLREVAESATPGPWMPEVEDGDVWGAGNRERVCKTSSYAYAVDAAFIATMSPLVALAMAAWLESEGAALEHAEQHGETPGFDRDAALAVADAVLADQDVAV